MNKSTTYVYDPNLDIEKQRLKEREKRTSLRRSSALDGISLPTNSKILDVGCGSGGLGFDLLAYSEEGSLVGIDIEPTILRVAMKSAPPNFKCDFIAGDAFSLPFDGGTFETVACQYVLQHLDDPISCLQEMRRVSRIGASGWNEIDIRIINDIWQGPDDRKAALKGTELSLTELKPQLIGEGLVTEAEFETALEQMYDYYCGDIFSVVFFITGFAKNNG